VTAMRALIPCEPSVPLLRRWMLLAVSALGVAGGFALLAVLTRTPAVQILTTAEGLHRAIAGHVTFSLIVWLLAFEAVLWILARGRNADTRVPRLGLCLALGGSGLLIIVVLSGRGVPILTDYVSVVVDPLFFVGLVAFLGGVGFAAWGCFDPATSDHGLLQHGMRRAAVAGLLALGACLLALPKLIAGTAVHTDFAFFQSLFWVPGHLLQFVNAIAMVSAWYLLLESGFGVVIGDSAPVRFAFNAYVVLASLLFVAVSVGDPRALPANLKLSVLMGVAVALPTAIHIGIVVLALVRNGRASASPEAAALICSLSLFGVGILLAVARARTGSSMWIPAHYHAVVVGGVTIALMGVTYRLLAETGDVAWPRLAKLQPWLYGLGMLLVVVGMNWAGSHGAPRKTFDPALGAAAARWVTPMNLMGLGGGIAVLGGAAFVVNAFWSLLGVPRFASTVVRPAILEVLPPGRGRQ